MGRMVVLCLVAVVSVLLLPMLAYAFFPVLVPWLVERETAALGVETLHIEVERPDLDGIRIHRLRVATDGYALELADVDLSWSLMSLRHGRLIRLDAATASLTAGLPAASPTAGTEPEDAAAGAGNRFEEGAGLFDFLPLDTARIETLSVFLPALGAAAHGDLDFAADQLSVHLTGEAPVHAQGLVLDARLGGSGQVELALAPDGPDGAPAFLNLHSSLPGTQLDMTVQARLSGFALDLVSTLTGLPAGSGLVTGHWQLALPWPVEPAPWQSVSGGGPVRADWASADGRLTLKGIDGVVRLAAGTVEANLSGRTELRLDDTRIELVPEHVRLIPDPLHVDLTGELTVTNGDTSLAGAGEAAVSLQDVGYAVSGMIAGKLTTGEDFTIPLRLEGNGSLDDGGAVASLTVTSGGLRKIPLNVRYEALPRRTEVRVNHPIVFSQPFFRSFWPGWNETYDLEAGTLEVVARLVSDPSSGLSGNGTVGLERVAAHVGPAAIRGLSGSLDLTLDGGGPRLDSGRLEASLVDFGVPLSEVAVDLAGTPAEVQVRSAAAKLLGGRASATPFSYRLAAGTAETVVSVEDLALSRVLALEGEHITGSGRLDGSLPIRLSGGAFGITNGRIAARPPGGTIRLQPSIARAITQPGLDLALAALTDFQFSLLEADVDYSGQGDLALGIRLEGRNPEVEKGRPIHFNLNVSENIPVLLQSLRLKDEFAERIERKVLR